MKQNNISINFTYEEWRAIKALLYRAETAKESIKDFYGSFERMADKIENEIKR